MIFSDKTEVVFDHNRNTYLLLEKNPMKFGSVSKAGVVHGYPVHLGLKNMIMGKFCYHLIVILISRSICTFWMHIYGLLLQKISCKAFYIQG